MSDIDELENRIDKLESRLSEIEQLIHDGKASEQVTGIREFIEKIDPTTHVERALAIAYYLEQHQGRENFCKADIEEGYRTCRIQKPANMSDVIASLEEKGWAMDDGKDGQSRLRRLTTEGLAEIEGEGKNDT